MTVATARRIARITLQLVYALVALAIMLLLGYLLLQAPHR
jgi:hypothetical protein